MSSTPSNTAPTSRAASRTRPPRRRSELQLPDGTKAIVAAPEEAAVLRAQYDNTSNKGGEVTSPPVQVLVHGSAEHQEALRQTQSHHAARRESLRERFGCALVDEYEAAGAELRRITQQLHRLTDHSHRLHANFSKFGFDARLRTHGVDDRGARDTGDDTDGSSEESSLVDWSERRGGSTLKLFKRPVIKQYFHQGLLWRSGDAAEVMSFELFFDLLYVGIIAVNGDHASEDATGHELMRFVITFGMSWKIWSDVMQLISWFETDDLLQRVEILFLIACLLGLTTNMLGAFGEEHDTYVQLVGFYLAARFFMGLYCALTGYLLPLIRGVMISLVANILIAGALWIASTQVESSTRYGLAFGALAIDLFMQALPAFLFRYSSRHDTELARKVGRLLEFYPATNIEHRVERTNAFVSLVIGYSVVGLIYSNAGYGLNAFLGKAMLGLVQAFVFNWLYFEIDGGNLHTHAIRRKVYTAILWQWSHLLFIMSFILSSAALCRLVLVRDSPDTDIHTLAEISAAKSEEEVPLGLRFFYSVGLGLALFSMGLVSLSHEHKIPPTARVPKSVRLANRLVVCVVFFALPATELSSLHLIAVTTSLSVWVLLLEIWGKSCQDESFFMRDQDRCQYTARCSRRRLDEATKSDGNVNVVELSRAEKDGLLDVR